MAVNGFKLIFVNLFVDDENMHTKIRCREGIGAVTKILWRGTNSIKTKGVLCRRNWWIRLFSNGKGKVQSL